MDEDRDELDEPGVGAGPTAARLRRDCVLPVEQAGQRLDQALASALPEHSRARIQRWIRDGAVRVDGAQARPRRRVLGGERVAIDAPLLEDGEDWARPEPVPFAVVHEDAALLVVDKPAGLVVHPGAGNPTGTLVNGLLHRFPELAGLPRAGIVHRLDKDTSGLLVVARSAEAHTALVRQLADRSMGRGYLAVVEGLPVSGFTVDEPIGRDPRNRLRMAVVPAGRPAVTHVRVEERYRAHALLACRLETGRTHQIRVHLRHRRHPIVGDPLYGARGRLPPRPTAALAGALRAFRRQALHAAALRLRHPLDGLDHEFRAPLPEDLAALLAALRDDVAGDAAVSEAAP